MYRIWSQQSMCLWADEDTDLYTKSHNTRQNAKGHQRGKRKGYVAQRKETLADEGQGTVMPMDRQNMSWALTNGRIWIKVEVYGGRRVSGNGNNGKDTRN